MITIEQLLESVDLDFEPRWVTKNSLGSVAIRDGEKPRTNSSVWLVEDARYKLQTFGRIKLAEFDGKDWTECIYEVPRKDKPVVKIEKLNLLNDSALLWGKKINELVAAVNELKGAKNE